MNEKIAFRMQLKPGCLDEYRARHDALWPELRALFKSAGVCDYSIHHDSQTGALFATLWREAGHSMDMLPAQPVMRRWWEYMADLMETNEDHSPLTIPLETVFHLE